MTTLRAEQGTNIVSVLQREPLSQLGQNFAAAKVHLEECGYTREILAIPLDIHERVQRKEKGFLNRQYDGFFVSREGFYYKTKEDLDMFCES